MSSLVQEAIFDVNAGRWTEAEYKARLSFNPYSAAALNVLGRLALRWGRTGRASCGRGTPSRNLISAGRSDREKE
jgi:hypothetical protein